MKTMRPLRAPKAARLHRMQLPPANWALHPMAVEVGCFRARDFPATGRAAPVPLPGDIQGRDVMSSTSTSLPRENRMESCSQNPSAVYLEPAPTAANKPIET